MFYNKLFVCFCCLLFLSSCTSSQSLRRKPLLLSWPLASKTQVSKGFSPDTPHHGIDLTGHLGRHILSAHQGYVVYVGNDYKGYGNLVIVDSGQGWSTFYAHLQDVFVKESVFVERGQAIGTMGLTGKTTGPHLHFELRHDKVPVDPQKYLP